MRERPAGHRSVASEENALKRRDLEGKKVEKRASSKEIGEERSKQCERQYFDREERRGDNPISMQRKK